MAKYSKTYRHGRGRGRNQRRGRTQRRRRTQRGGFADLYPPQLLPNLPSPSN
jgi:hypothetical protein